MNQFFQADHYRDILKLAFDQRRNKNARYSVRAFSRDVSVDPSHMTRLLNGTKGLSHSSAKRLVQSLNFSDQERRYFLNLITIYHGRDRDKVKAAAIENEHLRSITKLKVLNLEEFNYISDWIHFAVFSVIMLMNGQCDAKKISIALNVSVDIVEESIRRLLNQNVLELTATGAYKATDRHVRVESQKEPVEALRRFHKGIMHKAIESVSQQSPNERELASAVLTFKASQINEAKSLIRDFEANFRERFAFSNDADTVYAFSIQFFKVAEKKEIQ